MGIATILAARRVVLMASEASKARPVRALLDGPTDPQWPCSLLRDHQNLEVFATAAAIGVQRAR
jgi:glucosamine-6-phosphate deaminase